MLKLTESQTQILWDSLRDPYYHSKRNENIDDLKFLESNGLIEVRLRMDGYISFTRILPDGVLYLCIETEFIDFSLWSSMVEDRLNRNLSLVRLPDEVSEYKTIAFKLLEAAKRC